MSIFAKASNVRTGEGSFTVADFTEMYPQFGGVPETVLQMYVDLGNKAVLRNRWNAYHKMAFGLFVAHWITLYMETYSDTPLTPAELRRIASTQGEISSKSVDGVSVSYGQRGGDADLVGWSSMKDTVYGQQFASLAKLMGMGGMYVV